MVSSTETFGLEELANSLIMHVNDRLKITDLELTASYLDPGLCRKVYVGSEMMSRGKTAIALIEVGLL